MEKADEERRIAEERIVREAETEETVALNTERRETTLRNQELSARRMRLEKRVVVIGGRRVVLIYCCELSSSRLVFVFLFRSCSSFFVVPSTCYIRTR